VVVVDPPYEQTDERARITATLAAAAHRKWAHGVTVIWYPLKERSPHAQWKHQLRKLGIPKFLNVEHWLYDADQSGIYNGAGLSSSTHPTPSHRRCHRCWKPCAPRWHLRGIEAR
jgi:23S rRNA (adenine2030-N6)-methyltransferase